MPYLGENISDVSCDWTVGIFAISWFSLQSTDARDQELLAQHNITHILSIHDTAAPVLEVGCPLSLYVCVCVWYWPVCGPAAPNLSATTRPSLNSLVLFFPAASHSYWKCEILASAQRCHTAFSWLNIFIGLRLTLNMCINLYAEEAWLIH